MKNFSRIRREGIINLPENKVIIARNVVHPSSVVWMRGVYMRSNHTMQFILSLFKFEQSFCKLGHSNRLYYGYPLSVQGFVSRSAGITIAHPTILLFSVS